jgi:hypothetical protein
MLDFEPSTCLGTVLEGFPGFVSNAPKVPTARPENKTVLSATFYRTNCETACSWNTPKVSIRLLAGRL